jgi:hypothetical protein
MPRRDVSMDKIVCISPLFSALSQRKFVQILLLASKLLCPSVLPHMKFRRGPRERNFVIFYIYKFYENLFTITILYQSVIEKITDSLREHLRALCAKTERSESKSLVLFEAKNIL